MFYTEQDRTDYYYNEAWQVVEERYEDDAATKTAVAVGVRTQYVWDVRYIDAPACRFHDTAAGDPDGTLDQTGYYTSDANMNVTALVGSGGTVLERYDYDPYGKVTIYSADWSSTVAWADSEKNEILYCGYRYDDETGLYHVRYRPYHPTLGRWLGRDPVVYLADTNMYAYVLARAATSRDPMGLSPLDVCCEECRAIAEDAHAFMQEQERLFSKMEEITEALKALSDKRLGLRMEVKDLREQFRDRVRRLNRANRELKRAIRRHESSVNKQEALNAVSPYPALTALPYDVAKGDKAGIIEDIELQAIGALSPQVGVAMGILTFAVRASEDTCVMNRAKRAVEYGQKAADAAHERLRKGEAALQKVEDEIKAGDAEMAGIKRDIAELGDKIFHLGQDFRNGGCYRYMDFFEFDPEEEVCEDEE